MQMSLEAFYQNKKVLVTGHTGFKGTWLSLWLKALGAELLGYSLPPDSSSCLFELTGLEKEIIHIEDDVRHLEGLTHAVASFQPDIVFHLAAQPIVAYGLTSPLDTLQVNAIGTANVLEACRSGNNIQAAVIVTTDKCYENNSWVWGYRENDPLGGQDPYSASKAMAELAVGCYRSSFFASSIPVATARAGNVIGGGDFSPFRLVPDCIRALLCGQPIRLRNPSSVRPWIHVLDCLSGYLMLAEQLAEKGQPFAEAWNFGPREEKAVTAGEIADAIISLWGEGTWIPSEADHEVKEMSQLKLNWNKACERLSWQPSLDIADALQATIEWYKAYEQHLQNPCSIDMKKFSLNQIQQYAETHEVYANLP